MTGFRLKPRLVLLPLAIWLPGAYAELAGLDGTWLQLSFSMAPAELTPAGRSSLADYVALRDDPDLRCVPASLTNVRVIHMDDSVDPASQQASRLGFSVGHWEDERTLVVETTRISFPWYNTSGVPQSENVRVYERFTLSADELRLGYEQVATDPATYTAPARLTGEWVAIPGIEIQPFDIDCSDNAYL